LLSQPQDGGDPSILFVQQRILILVWLHQVKWIIFCLCWTISYCYKVQCISAVVYLHNCFHLIQVPSKKLCLSTPLQGVSNTFCISFTHHQFWLWVVLNFVNPDFQASITSSCFSISSSSNNNTWLRFSIFQANDSFVLSFSNSDWSNFVQSFFKVLQSMLEVSNLPHFQSVSFVSCSLLFTCQSLLMINGENLF